MSVHSLPKRDDARPLTERVAEEVRALMGRYDVTQMQMVDVLRVSQTGVSKRLRGIIPFDANEIGVLAKFFEVDAAELVSGSRNPGTGPGSSRTTRQYGDHKLTLIAA